MKKLSLTSVVLLLGALWLSGFPVTAQETAPSVQPRRPAQAKTRPEFDDYNKAYATSGGASMEAAAGDFAAKYPNSELRGYLFSKAMREYQAENNQSKLLAMGEKVLALDPDNPVALVLTAVVLSDNLSDGDKDRDQKIAAIRKKSRHALETVDSSFVPPAGVPPEQIIAYKNTLRSMAKSSLGVMELKIGDDAAAEQDLQAAAELSKPEIDPYVWYHLALSQDHQQKYAGALVSVNQALQHIGSNQDLAQLAEGERQRLLQLTGASSTITQKPPQ